MNTELPTLIKEEIEEFLKMWRIHLEIKRARKSDISFRRKYIMKSIPLPLRKKLAEEKRMKRCERSNSECKGRITWEHCWTYAGRQIQEPWAIISLCEYHHLGNGLDKRINKYISLLYATDQELAKYPNKNWKEERRRADRYITTIRK